jgi:2-dehydropantoate 2-reductase
MSGTGKCGNMCRQVSVLGAGAVGLFYGAKLQKSGMSVEFLSRAAARTEDNTLKVRSIWGDFDIDIKAYGSSSELAPSDLIILTTKCFQGLDFQGMIKSVIKPESVILVLQNGLGIEEQLAEAFPGNVILGGLAFTCINRLAPLDIHHIDHGKIKIAALDDESQATAISLAKVFDEAGVDCEAEKDLRLQRWKKLIWNVGFNPISAITGLDTGKIMSSEKLCKTVKSAMLEVQTVAASEGFIIGDNFILEMINLTRSMSPYKTSMLLDKEAGREMETWAILDQPISIGKQFNINTPIMEAFNAILSIN